MPFFRAQAEQDRRRVKRQVNRKKEGENAYDSERNRLRQHMPGTQNREKSHKLQNNRHHERPADFFRNDFMATVHGVHAKRCSACKCDIQCE